MFTDVPWTCPACRLPIQHSESELAPRRKIVYRCHVCRLELVIDDSHSKLIVIPMPDTATSA